MSCLYLDTSHVISIGLFDENLNTIDFHTEYDKKSGTRAHALLDSFLKRNNLKINSIKRWYILSGPGSYTGMRVAEGIAQILELENFVVNGFYAYQIPEFAGVKEGCWVTSAFKGELFVYTWTENLKQKQLIPVGEFEVSKYPRIFYHCELPKGLSEKTNPECDTDRIIKKNAKEILSKVKTLGLRVPPHYFRPPEQEFTVSFQEK